MRAGYTLLTAGNGAEAVAMIRSDSHHIDVAILDVVMPEMGGREAYEKMRAIRPDLKFLFASGYSAGGIHTNFVLDSSLKLIQNPFAPAELLHAVRATLNQPAEA
jgi:CheY-like chemotaxis protein